MENAIPALVIGAILLAASSLMARGSLQAYDQMGSSIKQMEARLGEQARTRLTVTSAGLDGARDTLTVNLRNDGSTRLANFERVDVIVSAFQSASLAQTFWLAYTPGAPSLNTWTVVSIVNDVHEPGILNPGETAVLQIELSPVWPGMTNLVLITSDTGVTTSYPFAS